MRSWIRTALMWLLVAALPVQSWAAATMVNCDPSHHQMAVESAVAHDAMPHTYASGHDPIEPQPRLSNEKHAAANVPHADVNGGQPADADSSLQQLGKFKCSACASCCLGMALPSTVLSFNASVSSDTRVAGMPQAVAVFLTDGLDRPPRTLLA